MSSRPWVIAASSGLKFPVTTDKSARSHYPLATGTNARRNRPVPPIRGGDTSDHLRAKRHGLVAITSSGNRPIVYTVDGSRANGTSTVYLSPIPVTAGATIQAGSLLADGHVGLVASKTFRRFAVIELEDCQRGQPGNQSGRQRGEQGN